MARGIKTFGINASRRRSGGGGGGTSPASLSNITLFWDETKNNIYQDNPPTTPVTTPGQNVSYWVETIGGNNATIGSGVPDYAELGTNLLPAVNFHALDYMGSANVGNLNTNTSFTAGAAIQFDNLATTESCMWGKWGGAKGWFFARHVVAGAGLNPVFYFETATSTSGIIVYGSTTLAANQTYRMLVDSIGTDLSGMTMLLDGVEETLTEFKYGGADWGNDSSTTDPVVLGSAVAAFPFDGKLALPFLAMGSHSSELLSVDIWTEDLLG